MKSNMKMLLIMGSSLIVIQIIFCRTLFIAYSKQTTGNNVHIAVTVLKEQLSKEPSDAVYERLLLQEIPNIPFDFWMANQYKELQLNSTCAKYPDLLNLDIHNTYWQTFRLANVTLRLYGAYYDNREQESERPVVRILAMANQLGYEFAASYCQLWFSNSTKPALVPVMSFQQIWLTQWGRFANAFFPHLLSCKVPATQGIPTAVSLVSTPCATSSNSLRVHHETATTKQRFAVCVKGLDFLYNDISVRLIEWLELVRALGAAKVFMYYFAVHPNVKKVLHYYQQQGLLDTYPLTLATGAASTSNYQHLVLQYKTIDKRLNEIVPYNDCLYRNLNKFEYVAAIDVDEIIMPRDNLTTWHDLMTIVDDHAHDTRSKCPYGYTSTCFLNTFAAESLKNENPAIPKYLYMLQHTKRMEKHSPVGYATKCFHNTSQVLTLYNHVALRGLNGCSPATVHPDFGDMLHYRKPNPNDVNGTFITDTDILRYSADVVRKSKQTMLDLKFLIET